MISVAPSCIGQLLIKLSYCLNTALNRCSVALVVAHNLSNGLSKLGGGILFRLSTVLSKKDIWLKKLFETTG